MTTLHDRTLDEPAPRGRALHEPAPHGRAGDAAPARKGTARRGGWFGFLVAAAGMLVIAAQAGAPSPLYPLYAAEWHLSPLTMSVVFAIYVVGLLATLLTTGSLSDHVGRRPVAVAALAVAVAAVVVLVTAQGVAMLIVGRLLQGAAMGIGASSLGAALLDFAPASRPRLAATLNGALPPFGLAVGALVGSTLVEFGPYPTRTIYVVLAIALALLIGALFLIAERHEPRPGALRSLTPSAGLPGATRQVFVAVLGCLLASWALGGLYLATGPGIVQSIFHAHAPLVGGLSIAAVTATGGLVGIVTQGVDGLRVIRVGAGALVAGAGLLIAAVATGSLWLFFVASVIAGVGFGGAFQGGLRLVLAVAPAAQRAGVLSTVYIASYFAFGVPAVVAGILTPVLGLRAVVDVYAILVAALSAAALLLQLLQQRGRRAERTADLAEPPSRG